MIGPSGRARVTDRAMRGLSAVALAVPLLMLAWLLFALLGAGLGAVRSGFAGQLGSAAVGSVLVVLLGLGLALPIGVGAAIELEEYAGRGRWARVLELNASILAATPTVVLGLVGLELFARGLGAGPLTGALTLALVSTPLIMLAARGALRAASDTEREAALALGATQGQVLRHVVLPRALPDLLAGALLSLARAFGEAAALVVVAGAVGLGLASPEQAAPLRVLPLEIFSWVELGGAGVEGPGVEAAAGSLVLTLICLGLGGLALILGPVQRWEAR